MPFACCRCRRALGSWSWGLEISNGANADAVSEHFGCASAEVRHPLRSAQAPSDGKAPQPLKCSPSVSLPHWLVRLQLNKTEVELLMFISSSCCIPVPALPGLEAELFPSGSSRKLQVTRHSTVYPGAPRWVFPEAASCNKMHQKGNSHPPLGKELCWLPAQWHRPGLHSPCCTQRSAKSALSTVILPPTP